MANKERIDSIIDLQAITSEQQKALSLLFDLQKNIDDFHPIKLNLKGTDSLTAAKQASMDARSAIANLVNTLNSLEAAEKRIVEALKTNIKAEQEATKQTILQEKAEQELLKTKKLRAQEAERAQKISAKEAKAAADLSNDYKQLSLAYNEAALRAKNLALQQGSSSPAAKAAFAEANAMGDKLKEVDALAGQYQRNVGNYSSAFTGYATVLRGLRGPTKLLGEALGLGAQEADQFRLVLEHSFQGIAAFFRSKEAKAAAEKEGTAATEASTEATEQNIAANEARVKSEEELAAAVTERAAAERTTGTITEAGSTLQEVSPIAPVASEAATTATAADTTATAANTAAHEANNAVIEQGAAIEAATTAQITANSEAVAVNATALAENTIAAEASVVASVENAVALESTATALESNAVALESNAVGLQGVAASALEATAAETGLTVATNVNVATTELSVIATEEAVVAQEELALATTATSTAMKVLRIALLATGIGVVIGLIALVVYQMKEYSKRIAEAVKDTKLMSDVTIKAADSYGKERAELDVLVASLKDEHIPRKQKIELLKELHDKYPGYFDDIKTEKDLIDKLPAAYEKAAQGILLKAKVEAAQGIIGDNYKKQLEAEGKYYENVGKAGAALKDNLKNFTFGDKNRASEFLKAYEGGVNTFLDEYKKTVDDVGAENKRLLGFIVKSDDDIAKLGGKFGKDPKAAKEKAEKDQKDYYENVLKMQNELKKLSLQSEAELYKSIYSDDKENGAARIDALKSFYDTEIKLAEGERDGELKVNAEKLKSDLEKHGLTAKQKADITEASSLERQAIEEKFYAKLQTLRLQDEKDEKAIRKQMDADFAASEKSRNDSVVKNTKSPFDNISKTNDTEHTDALAALDDQLNKQLISVEEYNKKKDDIEKEFNKRTIDNNIALYEALINNLKLYGADTTEYEKQLNEWKRKLYGEDYNNYKDINDKKKKDEQDLAQKKKELAEGVLNLGKTIGDAGYENELNHIQDLMDANDAYYAKEILNVKNSTLSEEDKAAKTIQLEAEQAAKKAQLDKQARTEKLKEAKFDRDMQALKIVGETLYQAAKAGWVTPLAIAIEAIGAVELATLYSKPLPRYAVGTSSSPEGPAIVGELGAELYKTPSGEMGFTPSVPTLTWLEKGTQIIPHDKVDDALYKIMLQQTAGPLQAPAQKQYDFERLESLQEHHFNRLVKAVERNKPQRPAKNNSAFQAHIINQVYK